MITQPVLTEMTGPVPTDALLFLLTATAGENHSDNLVSPYDVPIERAIRAISSIDRWAEKVLLLDGIDRIRLWTTEGYDHDFQRFSVRPGGLVEIFERELRENSFLPPALVTIQSRI